MDKFKRFRSVLMIMALLTVLCVPAFAYHNIFTGMTFDDAPGEFAVNQIMALGSNYYVYVQQYNDGTDDLVGIFASLDAIEFDATTTVTATSDSAIKYADAGDTEVATSAGAVTLAASGTLGECSLIMAPSAWTDVIKSLIGVIVSGIERVVTIFYIPPYNIFFGMSIIVFAIGMFRHFKRA